MSLVHQSKPIVRDGLVFCIDPISKKSLIKPMEINLEVYIGYFVPSMLSTYFFFMFSNIGDRERKFVDGNGSPGVSYLLNPTIVMFVGDTLKLNVVDYNNLSEPLWIKTSSGTGTGNAVSTPAAINNGSSNQTISWTPYNAGTYYYNGQSYGTASGSIIVKDDPKTIFDVSGYGQFNTKSASMGKATVVGNASYTGVNNAIYLNGGLNGNYIKLPLGSTSEAGENLFGTNWSFDIWAYYDDDPMSLGNNFLSTAGQALFTMNSESSYFDSDSSGLVFGWTEVDYKSNTGSSDLSMSWTAPSTRTWHHFCMTLDNGTGTVYIDGASVNSKNDFKVNFSGDTGQRALGVAGYFSGPPIENAGYYGNFKGFIGGFKHYTRTLSATEVSINYNATKGRFGI